MLAPVSVTIGIRSQALSRLYFPPLLWVDLAAEIKRAVKIPVACAGRIRTPAEAEQLLVSGEFFDLIQMARALIADPELPNKARAGRSAEIRTSACTSVGLLGTPDRGLAISCVQNPSSGANVSGARLCPRCPQNGSSSLVADRRGCRWRSSHGSAVIESLLLDAAHRSAVKS